ncbi:MAG TPA: hypothetical protein V6C58_05955 [Allocoleopsis sp.]
MQIKKILSTMGVTALLLGLQTGLYLNNKDIALAADPCHYNHGFGSKPGIYRETENFIIYICPVKNSEVYYYGKNKFSSDSTEAILGRYTGGKYVFRNGSYIYTVTSNFLIVTRNGKVLRKEKIIKYQDPEYQ